MRLRCAGAIGAMIKGDNLVMKRDFLENKGFTFLTQYMKETSVEEDPETPKLIKQKEKAIAKMLTILDDLLKFEKFLDREVDYLDNDMDY